MRYLKRTKNYMLTYKRSDQLEIIVYSNLDFARCLDSLRSTSGYIFILAGGAVSWCSAKQTLTKLYCDNKSVVLYSNNNGSSTKSKHIDIKFLAVKEKVQSGHIFEEHLGTYSMIVDPLTKELPPRSFMSMFLTWVFYSLRNLWFSGN